MPAAGSGEPLDEEELPAEADEEVGCQVAGAATQPDRGDVDDGTENDISGSSNAGLLSADFKAATERLLEEIAGNYSASSPDGAVQSRLRLQPGGTWWHSAHRSAEEKLRILAARSPKEKESQKYRSFVKAYKDSAFEEIPPDRSLDSYAGDFESVAVWELAEALGSWEASDGPSGETALALRCEHWSWKCSHPAAPMVLRPSEDGRRELDDVVEAGQLQLCYALRRDGAGTRCLELQTSGHPSWDLQQRHQRLRSLQAAFQTLGFGRCYTDGWPDAAVVGASSSADGPADS